MKIFFTASLRAKQSGFEQTIDTICDVIDSHYELYAKHILDQNLEEVKQWSFNKKLQYYNEAYKEIKRCDLFVAEVTYPSANVGYEIALALDNEKPVILLHQNHTTAILDLIHADDYSDQLNLIKYTKTNLTKKLTEILLSLNGSKDKRFTLLLPPYILNHLSRIAKKQKMPRAVYIRKLIEKDMREGDF